MKKNIFLLINVLLLAQLLPAQQKEIKSFSDLPVLNYSTTMLKAGGKNNID